MKKFHFLISLIMLGSCVAIGQQAILSKDSLKKKYENSDASKETDKNFRSAKQGTPLNDSMVLNPLQYINTYVFIDTADFEFESISADVVIKTDIPSKQRGLLRGWLLFLVAP